MQTDTCAAGGYRPRDQPNPTGLAELLWALLPQQHIIRCGSMLTLHFEKNSCIFERFNLRFIAGLSSLASAWT
jgi:hypothetical protein